ncbi:BTAD domain-containing putative transcriptional regulator [Thermopolyspora sp. NPDC052614]|uniref:ATP-binding protein n=1 Tax=Thermopolyspora sp. NPDC052614 TaxID=3155682 RepID=UPI00343673EC
MLIRVLGAIEAEINDRAVHLGGGHQRALLAMLLVARGDVVSVDRLIDGLWRGEPPPKAIASLQTYIAHLRRLLEPDRPPRAPARILVSAAPGYAIKLDDDAVDAWRFERLVRQARDIGPADPARAATLLDQALGLWRGAAYAEVADEEWAVAETSRLEELRASARELSVELTLRRGAPAEAVPAAEALTRQQPLREEGWRLLALALWGGNRQADALNALRRARSVLATELGLDPGPDLVELEDAILNQRMPVLHAALRLPGAAPSGPAGAPPAAGAHASAAALPSSPLPAPATFVGREAEFAALREAAESVAAGRAGIAVVTGEAGAGKSALLGRLLEYVTAGHWRVAVGRCPEDDGAPAAWAWMEALRPLAERVPPGEAARALAPLLSDDSALTRLSAGEDTSSGRFRLHRAVSEWLRRVAAERPLAVLLDDVHRADAETVSLLTALAEELGGARILLVVAYRAAEVTPVQEEALAALARRSPVRVSLRGLAPDEVAALVAAVCERPVDAETVSALAERTGGNPFYVRESARLLAGEGALVAISEVPEGVRDVLRRRLARLPPAVVTVLRLAAVVGREADVDLLVRAADADEEGVLDALDAGVVSGLLTEPSPGRVRFVHMLVRDTLYQDLSRIRRTRMHARIAEALRERPSADPTALAHHYARAGTAATAPLALHYSLRAAEVATRRYAHDSAVELLRQALECFERSTGEEGDHDARRVDILGALLRAQVRAGALGDARATRERAIDVAVTADREDLLIAALTAWTEPTPWNVRPYAKVDRPLVNLLMRLLYGRAERGHGARNASDTAQDGGTPGANTGNPTDPGVSDWTDGHGRHRLDPLVRARLLDTLAAELAHERDPRAAEAARELAELAAGLDDPRITAGALTARIKELDYEREAEERAALGAELASVAERHDLPAFRWYAEYVASTAAAARGDVTALRRHVRRCLEIADAYEMAEARGVAMCAEATLAHIAGKLDEAERVYLDAYTHMKRHGSLHADAFLVMAIGTMRITQGRLAELVEPIRALQETGGTVATDALALALAAQGRIEEARAARTPAHPLRRDYFFSSLATLRAMAVCALGERDEAEELIDALLPVHDHLPGTASTAIAMRPVAHTLGELSLLIGKREQAAEHFTHAVEIARRWEAPIWLAEAQDALTRCTDAPTGPSRPRTRGA